MRDRTAEQHMLDLYMLRQENQRLLDQIKEQQSTLDLQEQELRRLEAERPGITRVRRDEDGSVLLDEEPN
ncbi:hypothetical protein ACIGKL_01465 [Pseudomonas sp. NPDC077186]|uniref:hypothetical protein n=1 Tax=Pseudomonas sp. NPDC077186 TaxID=3364421 RepID=UPI0037C86AEC